MVCKLQGPTERDIAFATGPYKAWAKSLAVPYDSTSNLGNLSIRLKSPYMSLDSDGLIGNAIAKSSS